MFREVAFLPMRGLQFALFRAIHTAVRQEILRVAGTLRGTTNIRSEVMFNMYEREYAMKIKRNIAVATTHLHKALREAVSTPYPPPSDPGQSPHKRRGVGRAAISRRYVTSKMNTDFEHLIYLKPAGFYMALLETGFYANVFGSGHYVYVDPRPWVQPTIDREFPTIQKILNKNF